MARPPKPYDTREDGSLQGLGCLFCVISALAGLAIAYFLYDQVQFW